jgi:hypothetical protein
MAKRKVQNNTKGTKRKQGRRRPTRMADAMQHYAALLANPCRGPLVHAPGSSEGGQIARFESDVIVGNGATDTAGAIFWTPGAYNTTTDSGLADFVAATDGTATNFGNRSYAPGYTFLSTNASRYRCLAACMQIYWPGSELNRAGIVSGAQANYGFISTATPTTTVANIRAISPVVERMPTDYFEIKWAPNFADSMFRSPGNSTTARPEDGHSSLLATFAGIPVGTGVRVRLVIVVEWLPRLNGQVLASNTALYTEGSTFQVRKALDIANPDWWHRAGVAAAQFLSGATVAYRAVRGQARPTYGNQRIEL